MRKALLVFLLVFSASVLAGPKTETGYFSLKSVFGDADYTGVEEAAIGVGLTLGYRSNGAFFEYDYSQLTGFDLFDGSSITVTNQSFPVPAGADDNYDIFSHNAFVGYRAGNWVYAEFKLGHSYQRIKESSDQRRVLDEINTPAAGLEVGIRISAVGLAVQQLWLGDDHSQFALAFRLSY